MRLPFPDSIPYRPAFIFAVVVAGAQLLEGTDMYFTLLCLLFTLLWVTAFNMTGGMRFPSGTFVMINGIQTLVLPAVVKILIGEAGHTHLRAPQRIVEVYVCGMFAMLVGAIVSRTLRPKVSLLQRVAPLNDLRSAYYGSFIISLALGPVFAAFSSREDGSFGAFLAQADKFPLLMILMGVAYTVQRTRGRSSLSYPLGFLIVYNALVNGLFTFSKESFLFPLFAWVLMIAVLQVRLRLGQTIFLVAIGLFTYGIVVPYCSVGRNFDPEGRNPTEVSAYLLTHLGEVREAYTEQVAGLDEVWSYYGRPMGLLDRMNATGMDSGLVEVTDREGPLGYAPAMTALANFVPHILWKTKPRGLWGNQYAHEVGVLGIDDYSTGVSFSPSADAYHEGEFTGIFIVETLVMCLGFVLLDSLVGDVRKNLAGLVVLVYVVRMSSEGLLYGSIVACSQVMFGTFLTAVVCVYVFPIVSQLVFSRTDKQQPAAQAV